ncbi:MAG TPA: lysophospholipid acyltransferase family protein [Terriglobia bacterium]|nr:lysophospholipid acyltransferase family protein [Terriglobia bacterium]
MLGWLAALVVRLIGGSLRWEVVGWEHWEAAQAPGKHVVYTFWHSEIFAATWFWRKRGIVVMSGYNFDARLTAQVIAKHGYEIARGSASRGAARALVGMARAVQRGHDAAFTIDGPRGPRHVAKPGAVMLAKATGAAVLCFHIRPARAWVFSKSWDRTEIPRPFSRAAIFIAPPITVSKDANDAAQARKLAEVQAALDDLLRQGDEWRKKIGD